MNRKVKNLRVGIRLDIKKPPKVEIPKNVYNRKVKHKKGTDNENSAPFFIPSLRFNNLQYNFTKFTSLTVSEKESEDKKS